MLPWPGGGAIKQLLAAAWRMVDHGPCEAPVVALHLVPRPSCRKLETRVDSPEASVLLFLSS